MRETIHLGRDDEELESEEIKEMTMKTLLKWLGWYKAPDSMFEKYYDKFMYNKGGSDATS